MAGSTDPVENSGTPGSFSIGNDLAVTDDAVITDDLTASELFTTKADSTPHISLGGAAATNLAILPIAGAVPGARLKGATSTSTISNVADGYLVGSAFQITQADTTSNTVGSFTRTADGITSNTPGLRYGNAATGIHPAAGTMTNGAFMYVRKGWVRASWTNAQVVALGAALTGDISVCIIPARTIVHRAYVVIGTAATAPTTLTISVGRTGASYIDYVVASDAKAAANTVYGDLAAEIGTNLKGSADATALFDDLPSFTGTTTINAHFVATGANLDQTVGSTGIVFLEVSCLP